MSNLAERRKAELADLTTTTRSLQSKKATYEANFAKCSEMEYSTFSMSFVPTPPPPPLGFDHFEVMGVGATFLEALTDWQQRLDKLPQSGKELVWRVRPEADCYCDFAADKLIWKVYARMVIVP